MTPAESARMKTLENRVIILESMVASLVSQKGDTAIEVKTDSTPQSESTSTRKEQARALAKAIATSSKQPSKRTHQVVTVNGSYSYLWTGDRPLKSRDRVLLPSPHGNGAWIGKVTSTKGNGYKGTLKTILKVIED